MFLYFQSVCAISGGLPLMVFVPCFFWDSLHPNALITSLFGEEVTVPQLCPTLQLHGLYSPWNSPGQNTGVGCHFLLQGIFPTQGSNPGLLHCWLILYQVSHKGSPGILEWVAYPFSEFS